MNECKTWGGWEGLDITLECSCGEVSAFYLEEVEDWVTVSCLFCDKAYEFRSTMFVEMREKKV